MSSGRWARVSRLRARRQNSGDTVGDGRQFMGLLKQTRRGRRSRCQPRRLARLPRQTMPWVCALSCATMCGPELHADRGRTATLPAEQDCAPRDLSCKTHIVARQRIANRDRITDSCLEQSRWTRFPGLGIASSSSTPHWGPAFATHRGQHKTQLQKNNGPLIRDPCRFRELRVKTRNCTHNTPNVAERPRTTHYSVVHLFA